MVLMICWLLENSMKVLYCIQWGKGTARNKYTPLLVPLFFYQSIPTNVWTFTPQHRHRNTVSLQQHWEQVERQKVIDQNPICSWSQKTHTKICLSTERTNQSLSLVKVVLVKLRQLRWSCLTLLKLVKASLGLKKICCIRNQPMHSWKLVFNRTLVLKNKF